MKVVHCLYIKYFYEGCTVFVHGMPRFAPLEILQTLTNYPITTLCAPPTLYRLIQTNSIKCEKQLNYVNLVKLLIFCGLHKVQFMKSGYSGFISLKIAALVIVNLTRCSLQSDRVNQLHQLALPTVPGLPGGAVQIRTVKVGSAQIQMYLS